MMVPEAQLLAWLVDGQTALEAGQPVDAARAFAKVRDALPGDHSVALMLANAWGLAGRVADERTVLQRAWLQAVALDVPSRYELGTRLLAVGAAAEARACFATVVAEKPHDPAALGALAGATRAAGDPIAAWPIIEQALALAPALPALLLTAAQIRHALGDLTSALAWLDRADAVRPAHGPTQLQRSHTLLLGGISAAAWSGFEHRALPVAETGTRPWHGEPLTGQTIVVVGDQGLGDQFHFARYVPYLTARGAGRVTLTCHPSAVALFRASGFDAVPAGSAPAADWYVPLLSLPHWLATDRDMATDAVPYLRTAPVPMLTSPVSRTVRRLGLVWKGNPDFLATGLRDFDAVLLPSLMEIPNVEWVWLQYGERPAFHHRAMSVPPMSADWHETAVLLQSLDGVVTVDTSVAHLAGAMGLPGYVLLPYAPDWRWGLGKDRTAWYPTLTLLRQPAPGDWAGVVEALHGRLA